MSARPDPDVNALIKQPYRTLQQQNIERTELDHSRRTAYYMARETEAFLSMRVALAKQLFNHLDTEITDGKIAKMTEWDHGVQIKWSEAPEGDKTIGGWTAEKGSGDRRSVLITLNQLLLDDVTRMNNAVAHEFCHAAQYLLSNDYTDHGQIWWNWVARCRSRMPNSDINIDQIHAWTEEFNWIWTCKGDACGKEVGSHEWYDAGYAKCQNCGSGMVQTNPVPRATRDRRHWIGQ